MSNIWNRINTLLLMLVLLALQIVLGLTGIAAGLPLLLVTAHNAGAAILLLAVVNLNYRITPLEERGAG